MPTHQELPELFGRYRILKKLGAGGMGAVYLAEDAKLRRKVALKVPHFTAGMRVAALERFQREARLAAGIDHPNFCPVFDVDEIDGIHYFTMTYIEGTPLSDLMADEQPWPPAQAVDIVRRVALAVGELHSRGIVHRDLKPANVMVRPSGEPVLMDFGLACALTSQSQRLTATGEVIGTPAYMPPEQLQGERKQQGPASDVYSLGMILYQLLTGQLPFEGSLAAVCAQALCKVPEAPSALRPGMDARLDALCLMALAKKPVERFPDTSALVAALEEFLRTSGEQRLKCPQCGKGLKVPASMAGKRLKCPQCGTSLDAATRGQPGPGPSLTPETRQPSLLETTPGPTLTDPSPSCTDVLDRSEIPARPAAAPAPPAPAGRPTSRLLILLGGVMTLLVLGVAHCLSSRQDGSSEPNLPGKDAFQKKDESGETAVRFTIKMEMVHIKNGIFKMGSPPQDKDQYEDEVVQHWVKITRDFYMGATEVTRGQFKQFVQQEGYKTEAERDGKGGMGYDEGTKQFEQKLIYNWKNVGWEQDDNHPVVNVTWNDAMAFCKWLSKKEKKDYDLPTEAEWEYACRAGTTTRYHSGDDSESLVEVGNIADASAKAKFAEWPTIKGHDGYVFTAPVRQFKPNAWGLYDMHGNVWEWCKDAPRKYPTKEEAERLKEPIEDPISQENGDRRVVRGGSCCYDPRFCRSAHRDNYVRAYRYSYVGFRVVMRLGARAR